MTNAFIPIKKGTKKPLLANWNLKENAVTAPGDAHKLAGHDLAIAHAYSDPATMCLDIDDLEKAKPILKDIGIDPQTIDAARCKSGRTNSLKIFFSLPDGCDPVPTQVIKSRDDVIFELRCATAKGKTVCDVIPPSKHPSGTTYSWDGSRDLRNITEIPEKLLHYWLCLIEAEKAEKKARENARLSNQQYDDAIDNTLLTELLGHISSDCDYHLWIEIIFAIRSSGFPNSEIIARSWSEASPKFNNASFKAAWDSYRDGHYTVGTLIHHAKQNGWQPKARTDSAKDDATPTSSSEVGHPEKHTEKATKKDPLEILHTWSSTGRSKTMRQQMLDDKFVIKDMCILGQFNALYAAPNTGKTLLILKGLVLQILAGELDASKLYYVNADDHGKGSIEKLELAEQYGFHMLLPNESGFQTKHLFPLIRILIDEKKSQRRCIGYGYPKEVL